MTDMEHRDTGQSAQDQARQRMQGAQGEAEQRGQGARDEAEQRMQGTRQKTESRAAVPEARRSEEGRRAARGEGGAAAMAGGGWMVYAGTVLIVLGAFQAIWGFTALLNTGYFIVGDTGLAVSFNYTAWAWIHIALAVLLICTGLAIFGGQTWARYVGIALAALAALGNFLTLAAFPVWSLVLLAVDILVIYALAVHGRDMESSRA
jgi:hypothetical protein